MEKYNTLKNRKDYENFILEIPNNIKKICQLLNKSLIEFSEEEVRIISEKYINYKNDGLFDIARKRELMSYCGEFFRYHFGGEWDFTGLKSDSWAINEPVITKYKDEGIRMSPSEWIFGMFESESNNHFNDNVNYIVDSQKKREDLFEKLFPERKKK